ncbi:MULTISPECIES: DUF1127 domain-containing protein [Rhodopseudomonas]|uniref:DUF1127 domain-containing protein n=1 Tax=Rhodopseudomonas palustris TaxID=1076 RepID=A0A0D7ECX9_RHOPL|nr:MULTISPECIES: DUF1127 domain-containing protein [Rhodopseudomonas]KIZ37422.1 hypothetical protein OO17_23685 [Rhodopseudomonas palustris]MDF3814016.1 DUF1127 domain-containing protein [Rhodopseudomonas sp. BAL398]WOK16835.1 DUF1127 domain-containing protein [Rhodopseudomonas sp. BAL398]
MADDDHRYPGRLRDLTPQQWTELRRTIIAQSHAERDRAIRKVFVAAWGGVRMLWRIGRRLWLGQQARNALRAMSDNELRDLGIRHHDIDAAIVRGRASDLNRPGGGSLARRCGRDNELKLPQPCRFADL